ncbi:hypothetical protein L596_025908 [Steinernema carpocapsae]|uniref:Uncharacterized protein n=1 Tax=Steinernema carpocapsae TaxID=34508 RepID=A0A4U5M950_STECR|nr:hypothetical protein L596_025908 [Steinernema carpocapsae]
MGIGTSGGVLVSSCSSLGGLHTREKKDQGRAGDAACGRKVDLETTNVTCLLIGSGEQGEEGYVFEWYLNGLKERSVTLG